MTTLEDLPPRSSNPPPPSSSQDFSQTLPQQTPMDFKPSLPLINLSRSQKGALMKKAYITLILCLGDQVLQEVTKETTDVGIWTKLNSLYMTKSLENKLYLKKKLYTYYMSPGTKRGDRIDEFNKLILDLANIDIEIEDEDQTLMLLALLPSSYENFVETLLYVRSDHSGKAHSGRSSRFKSRGGTGKLKCFICHSEGHLKRDCLMKKSCGFVKKGKRDHDSDSFFFLIVIALLGF
ncbi:retrovirus-related pol polyprotein from transposon TNT 1-94 [Tanacetum coccineum]